MHIDLEKVAGVDEVGRGSLFGPVLASAVILNQFQSIKLLNAGLKDSKKLTKPKIQNLSTLIKKTSIAWGLGQASAKEIDNFGIRTATERAMIRALQRLPAKPEIVLVDGILPIRGWQGLQKTIPRGETHSPSIAAASIIAKEYRDKLMIRIAKNFPKYGINHHMGYGTEFHRRSIKLFGPTKLHRLSFIKKIYQ
tara:strand:- start:193 stop:777 length:585 start_codon:yes stop_codon:yes gene_type:complete